MGNKSELAAGQLEGGFTCSTSVLLPFCEDYDLDTDTAARLSCGFGGGCSSGELCGAAAGAVMVIGLKHGQESAGDAAAKANCRGHVTAFLEKFKEKNGALTCRDLLGCDTSTEEGFAIYQQKRGVVCFGAVRSAADILEESGF